MTKYYFTSESVTSGHPDKICDLIADSILDEALRQDPDSHMAVEATIKDDLILIYGEAGTKAVIPYEQIALDTMKKIGYTEDYKVYVKVNRQSPEINSAVTSGEISAGDQGIMFGFACDETPSYMPFAIDCAHRLAERLEEVRRQDDRLRPDGKTQVTAQYIDGVLKRVDTVVVSTCHSENITQEELRDLIIEKVILPVIPSEYIDENTKYLINPSAASRSAEAGATPARPAERSSWTATAATLRSEAAASLPRTRPRSTAPLPITHAMYAATSLPTDCAASARSRYPTPSESRSRHPSMYSPSVPPASPIRS